MARIVAFDSLQPFQAVNLLSDPGHIAGPVVIPNACRIRINWNLGDGKVAHNICYAQWNGTPALTVALADSVKAALVNGATWTALAAFINTATSLASVTLLDVRSATATEVTSAAAATVGAGTAALPDEVAVVLTLRTANRGPSGRGRIYIPGFAQAAMQSGNVISPGAVTAVTNWGQSNLMPAASTTVGPLALGLPARSAYTSPTTGRIFPARAATTVIVTSTICRNNTWDSQRRRGLQ